MSSTLLLFTAQHMIAELFKHEDQILHLFYIIDELCEKLLPKELSDSKSKSGRKPKLTTSELITIGVIFAITNQNTFHGFYRLFKMNKYFTNLPEYSRLLRNVKKATYSTMTMLVMLTAINRIRSEENRLKIIDSAPLPVVANKRIFGYKVTGLADRGMSSMGWFYGFKIHVVIDSSGKLLRFKLTAGNVSDKDHDLVMKMFEGIEGLAVGDKGYLSIELKEKLMKQGVNLMTGMYKNMKKKVTEKYHYAQKFRQIVETVIGQIKYRKACVSSLPRSLDGYFFRYANAIFAYVLCTQFI